jgi:hypothetical protein
VPDFTRRVARRAAGDLQPGEAVLRAVVAQPPGSLTRGINEPGGNLVSGLRQGRRDKREHGAEAAGLAAAVPPRNVYLTLTDRRLLVHTMSVLGSPKALAAALPLDRLARLTLDQQRNSGILLVRFADGTSVDFLVVKSQHPEEFLATWDRLGD